MTGIDLQSCQIILKDNPSFEVNLEDSHFDFILDIAEFENISKRVLDLEYPDIVIKSKVVDSGTEMERKKMDLKNPGYLIELKGYK